MTRPSTNDNTDTGVASIRAISSQACRRRRGTASKASKVFSRPQQQHRGVSQIVGVGVCGLQTLTVPESQPYIAETVHPSLLGRFYRPKNVTFELSMKLNVTEGDSSWTLSTPGYCGVGSNQNALPGLSNDFKPSALPVGGAKGGGTSRKNTSRGGYPYNFTYRHDDEGGADPVEDPCKIEYPKWEALPKALAYVLPLSLERKLPPTPLRISPMLESGQTKILCVSTISPDLPQFNFEVRIFC